MNFSRILAVFTLLLVSSNLQAITKPIPKAPELAAESFILMDFASGRILAQKEPDKRVEPASITKLMTGYLVFKALADGDISLDDQVTIT